MRKMDIVITMAGLGSRFRKAGHNIPKYMITVKGKTLFEWSMASLKGFEDIVNQYIFIVMKDEVENVEAFINNKCIDFGIDYYKIIVIDYLTDGQAATAMLASEYWDKDNSLLVYNIDTYIEENEMNSSQLRGDGFIPCFNGDGTHWSFVKVNENGKAIEVREKEKISDNCTLGAYYFKTCNLYENLYKEYYSKKENLVNGEKYIAPLYNYLIQQNGEIYISQVNKEKVHVLGTPDELRDFVSNNFI